MTITEPSFTFLIHLLLRDLMKPGFLTEAERAAMRAYLVVPTAGWRVRRLNNNSDNSNPRCLPIRTTFFNNNDTYH